MLVWGLLGVLVVSFLAILFQVNRYFLVATPAEGGSLTEGIIGTPRFANPLLAITDADRDVTMLVYSGLMRATPDGDLIPDLAESYEISEDGLIYTFRLREEATFHDGEAVTADDVVFTIEKAIDPLLKSPRRANWEGVAVEKIDDRTVSFTLREPYAPFLENTTLGILPRHLWGSVTDDQFPFSDLNNAPVGSGPYRIDKVERDSSGIPVSEVLRAFPGYVLGKPNISRLTLRFYQNAEAAIAAYERGEIEGVGSLTPADALSLREDDARIEQTTLPRVFALFFNQNQAPVFVHHEVRVALAQSVNRQEIADTVFGGYASPIEGPIPPGLFSSSGNTQKEPPQGDIAASRAYLEKNGWRWNEEKGVLEKKSKTKTEELSFSIATANVEELRKTGELLKASWEALGARVDLKVFEPGDLNQNVIRPRKYDSLLFGEIVGRELDLYAFWHSSQRNDPGLNVAMYANITTDKLLETIRGTSDSEKRETAFRSFEQEIASDVPAVFIYSPDFLYLVPDKVQGVSLGIISSPSERFLNVREWYIETDNVWSIFL